MRIAIVMIVAAGFCQAQTPAAPRLQFEVASVKSSPVPPVDRNYTMNDTRVDLGSIPLKNLIQFAYSVEPYQVSGPDWMATTRFDILAKLPAGATKEQIPEMLQALLADRFGLVLHHEAKDQEVYALVTGKDGPKLKDAAPDNHPDTSFLNERSILSRMDTEEGDDYWTISTVRSDPSGRRLFDAPRITMPELARTLKPYVDLPVIDMTGLKGPYRVTLDVPRRQRLGGLPGRPSGGEGSLTGAAPDPDGEVSIFTSVRKLGLMLQKRTAPVDHIVVDHIEKIPTEN